MRTALTLSPDQFAFLASVVRYRGDAVQPHGERFVWQDSTTPRTAEPARFFYHWESKVGVSHVGNVVAPWGRNTYRR